MANLGDGHVLAPQAVTVGSKPNDALKDRIQNCQRNRYGFVPELYRPVLLDDAHVGAKFVLLGLSKRGRPCQQSVLQQHSKVVSLRGNYVSLDQIIQVVPWMQTA